MIGLSKVEEALLQHVGKQGVTLVSQSYEALQVHPQVGHRARKKLDNLGLLSAETIVCRKGRGGTGIALRLTDAGQARLRLTPPGALPSAKPRHSRGGDGVQHQWLVLTICRAFNVDPDVIVGKKPIDILIPYNTTTQELLDQITSAAHPVGKTTVLNAGMVIGIEIETDYPATALNNATKNYEAGVNLTIISVMKDVLGAVSFLQDKLPTEVQDTTMVTDALDIIDILRARDDQKGTP